MNREDIIRMAREAGFDDEVLVPWSFEIHRFFQLATEWEREQCAKVLDEMADDMVREMEPSTAIEWVRNRAAFIRARGETR